jgi:lysozyme
MNQIYLDKIRVFEGFAARANWDYQQNTNGYGTKAQYPGEIIDKAEAERRFQVEVEKARAAVARFAPQLDEGSAAALTSLTFNAGQKWMTSGLGQSIKAGDLDTAKAIFKTYAYAGGQVLPGLQERRQAETEWFGAIASQPGATADAIGSVSAAAGCSDGSAAQDDPRALPAASGHSSSAFGDAPDQPIQTSLLGAVILLHELQLVAFRASSRFGGPLTREDPAKIPTSPAPARLV